MIEIFEALVNILEAEEVHPDLDLDKVKEGRRIAENRVKNLIKTLDSVTRPDSGNVWLLNFFFVTWEPLDLEVVRSCAIMTRGLYMYFKPTF